MAIIKLRRWEDNILLCDNCVDWSGYEWRFPKPINTTITGVNIPRSGKTMEKFWTAKFEFASDDPINTFARYDRFAYDAMSDDTLAPVFFRFVDLAGAVQKCRVVEPLRVSRIQLPLDTVLEVEATFKMDGHIR